MVDERLNFAVSMLGLVVGLGILLFGVAQNAGQSLNEAMIVGGVVVLAAFAAYTRWIMSLDEPRDVPE